MVDNLPLVLANAPEPQMSALLWQADTSFVPLLQRVSHKLETIGLMGL